MAAPRIKSKRYGGTAPAVDKDDKAIADRKGSSAKSIKTRKGGSTNRRPVSGRSQSTKKAPSRFGKF